MAPWSVVRSQTVIANSRRDVCLGRKGTPSQGRVKTALALQLLDAFDPQVFGPTNSVGVNR